VASRLDLVALSLLWTERERRRRPRPQPEGEAGADGAAPDVWALADLDQALRQLGIDDATAVAASLRDRACRAMAAAAAKGIRIVARGEADYPLVLERIPDPPPVLWTRGRIGSGEIAVAVVGSRSAAPHGLEVAFRLGRDLARAGLLVVSGLARGIDAEAHRGALRAGGRTAAVLGCGVDVAYPPEHAALAREIETSGAVLSEFAPGVPPRGWHFPRRNRIISGLSLGVVIVEASCYSGSLITARCALEQNRSVMAVPGTVLSGRNRGAHRLLRDGAPVVEDARDVVEVLRADWAGGLERLGLEPGAGLDAVLGRAGEGGPGSPARPAAGSRILKLMRPGESYGMDDLSAMTGLPAARLLAELASLEVAGWVRRVEGGQFVKAGANVLT